MATPISPARRRAFAILRQVALASADPASLLHSDLSRDLKPADLDLATELVYGTLRWQGLLDFILEAHARRPAAQIDPPLLVALRLGLYQIRYLTRVPARAAVDEAVKLARASEPRGGQGFVNAVLRSICRRPDYPALPTKKTDPLRYLSITLSHPEWLARRYLERLGIEAAEAVCLRQNRPPPTDLRVEPPLDPREAREALAREGVLVDPFPLVPGCLRVRSGKPTASSLYRSGQVFIQEAGSQILSYLLGVGRGSRVLDACAAPGAKATQIARWIQPELLLACDRSPKRLALLTSLARRIGCPNVVPVGADAGLLPFNQTFRHILLDAPCSSLGTLARNPDIKWRLREEDLAVQAGRQFRLIASCAALTAPGGRLVYATCSTEPEENEQVVAKFLATRPAFHISPPPGSFPEEAAGLISQDGALRTRPERDDMDGYYAVVLERQSR